MASQDKLDKILSEKSDQFEKVFDRLDKDSDGQLKIKQLENFWKNKGYDMTLLARIKERFGIDNNTEKNKQIDLVQFKQIMAIRILGKLL